MTPKLDYVPRLVEANRPYRVIANEGLERTWKFWTPGYPTLDQGREGACVGFGCTGEAMASPNRVRIAGWKKGAEDMAMGVYRAAKVIDEWEGVDYEGTSVRAGMLVGRQRNWWTGFRWCFNMAELRTALQFGPVVIGVEWREGSYEAPGGIIDVSGPVVGGHCLLVTGYTPRHARLRVPAYRLRNSWSERWGTNGNAYIDAAALEQILFKAGGEAAVPVGRL
jgi:hypothetical protein